MLGGAGDNLAADFMDLDPKDICVVLSISPHSTRATELASHAHEQGTTVITLTDDAMSPVVVFAAHYFF